MYQARILDKDRQLKAVLPGVRWHYGRRINEATDVSVYIPRETIDEVIAQDHALYGFFAPSQPFAVQVKPTKAKPNKAQYAEIAAFIQIYKGGTLKASGKINSRTLGEIVTVSAYTEEILLEGNLTPAQYGKVWDGWDLADVARDLLDGWQAIRVKDPEQWQSYMVGSSNIDLTSDPGLVTLAKRSNGRYYDNGHIVLRFNASEVYNFKRWDRVRWSADSDGAAGTVQTTIQTSIDGSSWSPPFDGGAPEEIGYAVTGTSEEVWVRINLTTTDTESEDPEGNPVGVTPTVFAVELIARTERGALAIGNVPSTAGVTVKGINADYASTFEVLLNACEQATWEFNVLNGALNVAENIGVDRTKDFVLRAGTNTEITTLGDGDDELVNILTAYGPGQGINRPEITLRDEASIAEFGEYPLAMEFKAETLAELQLKAQEFLSENNSPKTQFEVAVAFEDGTEPEYGLGDKVRVVDPETGIITATRVMSEAREYGDSELSVHLELGKAFDTLQRALEGNPPKRPIDPFAPTGLWAKGIVRGVRVGFSRPKGDWDRTEVHLSTAPDFVPSGSTLKDVGKQTQFDLTGLDIGTRYYVRVVNVDSRGDESSPSQEVSAVANYMSPELLPDYSLGVEKFMENLKPPIVVTSLPSLPDPRYTIGTSVFLTTDKKLYSTDGNAWEPVGAGTVTADEIVAGIITAGGIKADWYADIRNVISYAGTDNLDAEHPIEVDFYIPTETTNIVSIKLSAKALRYRAYARTADAGGSHTHQVVIPAHVHGVSLIANESRGVTDSGGMHTHNYGATGATPNIAGITTASGGDHSHSYDEADGTDSVSHYHTVLEMYGETDTDTHSHSIEYSSANTSSDGSHGGHFSGTTTGVHSHSIADGGAHIHSFDYYNTVPLSTTVASDAVIETTEYSESHTHDLDYGIYLDTTPANVQLFSSNDGVNYESAINLEPAPSKSDEEYVLATERQLTANFSGTGWKHIKFTSSRRGRITWHLIAKLDITA